MTNLHETIITALIHELTPLLKQHCNWLAKNTDLTYPKAIAPITILKTKPGPLPNRTIFHTRPGQTHRPGTPAPSVPKKSQMSERNNFPLKSRTFHQKYIVPEEYLTI